MNKIISSKLTQKQPSTGIKRDVSTNANVMQFISTQDPSKIQLPDIFTFGRPFIPALLPSQFLTDLLSNKLFKDHRDMTVIMNSVFNTGSTGIAGDLPPELNIDITDQPFFIMALDNLTKSVKEIEQAYIQPPKSILTLEDFEAYCKEKKLKAQETFKQNLIKIGLISENEDLNFKIHTPG
ncbi:MAG: hypothetical protein AB7V50_07595, partial [Vampirovibrionia bacterium]